MLKRKPAFDEEIPEKILKQNEENGYEDSSEPSQNSVIVNIPKELNFDKPLNIKIFRANLKTHFHITGTDNKIV